MINLFLYLIKQYFVPYWFKISFCLRYEFYVCYHYDSVKQYKLPRVREGGPRFTHPEVLTAPLQLLYSYFTAALQLLYSSYGYFTAPYSYFTAALQLPYSSFTATLRLLYSYFTAPNLFQREVWWVAQEQERRPGQEPAAYHCFRRRRSQLQVPLNVGSKGPQMGQT